MEPKMEHYMETLAKYVLDLLWFILGLEIISLPV